MVAYSFKKEFAAPIVAGTKRQTIRADRKRHARLGETLQLYTGMRTRHCRLVGGAICIGVGDVRLDFKAERVSLWTGVELSDPQDLDEFARRDGFESWKRMVAFWCVEHPETYQTAFTGVLIGWGESFEAAVACRTGRIAGHYPTQSGERVWIIAWDDAGRDAPIDVDADVEFRVGQRVRLVGRRLEALP